jgi:hypothetical protein
MLPDTLITLSLPGVESAVAFPEWKPALRGEPMPRRERLSERGCAMSQP